MRIAHVGVASDVPILHRLGGAVQRRIWELARLQARLGHDVTVYSFGEADRAEETEGVQVRTVRCATEHPARQLEFQARALSDLRRRGRVLDLLHVHGQPEAALLGRHAARCAALSYDNFYFRGGGRGPLGPIYRSLLGRFDLLLPCSEYCRRESAARWSLDPRTLHVLHNGVNLDQFRPAPAATLRERERLGLRGPVVLYVGRVCEQKGSALLLEAWPRVSRAVPDATLLLVGPVGQFGATDDGSWARRIAAAGARYVGPVDESRLAAVYGMAAVFVMPTVELEMFGMAAVEAQACGVPVIASDHGGLRETVPHQVGGRFANRDATDLARLLTELLRDEGRRATCAAAARLNAARFSWEAVWARLEELTRATSAGSGRAAAARTRGASAGARRP
jgi:glycosyltransferase involved in cell wall biosynthesis